MNCQILATKIQIILECDAKNTINLIFTSLAKLLLFALFEENAYFCKQKEIMATREQIETLKIDENIFELLEDTELEYLVHFAAPFTGSDKCMIPKGTAFAPHGPMRDDALYMHLIVENDELLKRMEEKVKTNYEKFYARLQGFSFFITEEQLRTLPLKFCSGSAERLLDIMLQLRSPLYPMFE